MRLLRHGRLVRWLHGLNIVVMAVLLASGLALGGVLAHEIVAWLGGHELARLTHNRLGLAFAAAMLLLLLVMPRRVLRLLRDCLHWRSSDIAWLWRFLPRLWQPQGQVPHHDGRFDPAQRLVFGLLLASLVTAAATGVYLYFLPPLGRTWLMWSIRVHIFSAWAVIVLLGIHIIAGIGLLPSHRGIARAMLGDGTVSATLAQRLWPGWARRRDRGS